MLLIWDIHLSAKVKSKVLEQLRAFISSKPEESTIIFLWDYVYHFSYDRTALLELFQYFLELYEQWKKVYILAWNHDWLSENFVFEEWKKVFDLLKKDWTLKFITRPYLTEIEGEKTLFLPFTLNLHEEEYECYEKWKTPLTEGLLESKEKNEIFSWKLNQLVNGFIKEEWKLTIIHHYYINKESFPWYRSSFSYKDIAFSEQLLDNPDITLISWHLHAPFIYKNYLCTWSIWPTSSLESNHLKGMFQYSKREFSFYASQPLYYLESNTPWLTTAKNLKSLYTQNTQLLKQVFESSKLFSLQNFEVPELDITKVILTLKVKDLDYDRIDEALDPKLREKLSDFRLKKDSKYMNDLLEKLVRPDEEKLQSFWWRQDLLKQFLKIHYPNEYTKYEQTLRELKII